jgi:hypothetical protein
VLEHEVPSQCVVLTWQVSRFAWLKMDQLQSSAGRQQTEVLCLLVLTGLFFCSSLHCVIVEEVADTLRQR